MKALSVKMRGFMSKNWKIRLNSIKTYLNKPQNVILILTGILVTFTTISPIVAIVKDTFQIHPGTIDQYISGKTSGYSFVNYVDLFTSRLAKTNLLSSFFSDIRLPS